MLTFPLPTGEAANTSLSLVERSKHYMDQCTLTLLDGSKVRPTQDTMESIFSLFDMFPNVPIAVGEGSYELVSDSSEKALRDQIQGLQDQVSYLGRYIQVNPPYGNIRCGDCYAPIKDDSTCECPDKQPPEGWESDD